MELISVVVICYNAETTIMETLESVKEQTYPNIELVISDDCSTDSTVDIAKKWIKKNKERFSHIILLKSKKNKGVVANGNRGIGAAKGTYIQVVAGDDRLPKEAVEEKYSFAKENNVPIVLSQVKPFGKNGIKVHVARQYYARIYPMLQGSRTEQLHKNLIKCDIGGAMYSFFSKEFFENMGGYDTKYDMIEDWPFILKLLQKDIPLLLLDKELYEHRISSTSLSGRTNNPLLLKDVRKIRKKNIGLLLKHGWFKDAFALFFCIFWK